MTSDSDSAETEKEASSKTSGRAKSLATALGSQSISKKKQKPKQRSPSGRKPFPLFIRTKEDFACGHCGASVKGSGYTNHCPNCLWSMHVDINPGDRKATCKGMMQPAIVDVEGSNYVITHVCMKCGHAKRNTAAPNDDFNALAKLVRTFPKPKK